MVKINRSKEWWMKKATAEETDANFVERQIKVWANHDEIWAGDAPRLFALARRGAAMQWRPISEAPKDGTTIAAFAPATDGERARAILVQWTGDKIWPWEGEGNGFTPGYFTHWMPLSPPPKGAEE